MITDINKLKQLVQISITINSKDERTQEAGKTDKYWIGERHKILIIRNPLNVRNKGKVLINETNE